MLAWRSLFAALALGVVIVVQNRSRLVRELRGMGQPGLAASAFAGVVQSPLTAFVIVLEMTSDRGMSMPLMAASLLAAGTSRLVSPEPLYHALSYNYDPKSAQA
jgi:hypothetical protein